MNNTGVTMLSILCATTPDRKEMFMKLYEKLDNQGFNLNYNHPMLGLVELVVDNGPRFLDGGLSIGKKREALAKKATGKYLAFLDSDEDIAPNYLEVILRLCNEGKHICTFRSFAKTDFYWSVIDMRLGNHNEEATPEKIVKRNAWHICPVWSEFAKLYEFKDINYGEDFAWMSKVLTHCKTEAHTDAIIHQYNHSKLTSEADRITKHEEDKIKDQKIDEMGRSQIGLPPDYSSDLYKK